MFRLGLEKIGIVVFRKDGYLIANERLSQNKTEITEVDAYMYFGPHSTIN